MKGGRTFSLVATLVAWMAAGADTAGGVAVDPHLFTDGMVLQRGMNVPIWGTGSPGEQVTVAFASQTKITTAGPDGKWRVELAPMTASSAPGSMSIQGTPNVITLTDVQVGEVWLCAGQSNMVLEQPGPAALEANPDIRALRFNDWYDAPGGVCWEFATNLQNILGVPIGIINNAKGGARIRTWLPPSTASQPSPVPEILAEYPIWGDLWQEVTVHLAGYAIRGTIWWQGESDSRTAKQHKYMLPALIRGWRHEWGQGDFPFIYVQLPNGKGLPYGERVRDLPSSSHGAPWASVMRQAFIDTLDVEPFTAMIVTSDLIGGIHPPPQEYVEYAARLLDAVLVEVYGEDFTYSGPIAQSATREGSNVRIHYRPHTADTLQAGGGPLQGFALTADGEHWEWADTATIDGNEVVVSSSLVPSPVAVRYGWSSRFRWANLYNERNMVSGPFSIGVTP